MVDNAGLRDLLPRNGDARREAEAVAYLQTTLEVSKRRACAVVGADRTSIRYRSCRGRYGNVGPRLRELT